MIPVQQPHDLVCVFSHYTFIVFLPEVYHNSYDAHVLKRRAERNLREEQREERGTSERNLDQSSNRRPL